MKTDIFDQIDQLIIEGDTAAAAELLQKARKLASTPTDQALIDSFEKMLQTSPKVHTRISEPLKPGISFVSCSMNRHDNLIESLKSWLELEVDEIVLVDWSSDIQLIDALRSASIDDDRIRVIRIEGEPRWILTYAFNVGLREVSHEVTYKLDADIVVNTDFLTLNEVTEATLTRGLWKKAFDADKTDQMYVNGSFGCFSKHLKNIGYYNELIRSYGWDDSDLYYRLTEYCGLETKYLDISSIKHLEQEENSRTEFQDVNENYFLDKVRPTIFNNSVNRITSALWDTWTPDKAQTYQLSKPQPSKQSIGKRISKDLVIPKWVGSQAVVAAANQFITKLEPKLAVRYGASEDLGKWLSLEFDRNRPFQLSAALIGNYFNFGIEVFSEENSELEAYLGYSKAKYVLIQGDRRDDIITSEKTLIVVTPTDLVLINALRGRAGFSTIKTSEPFSTSQLQALIAKS